MHHHYHHNHHHHQHHYHHHHHHHNHHHHHQNNIITGFFSFQLKGCPKKDVKEEVRKMIEVLHLEDKTKNQAQSLSGGMKRKLCVGIALIGGSKVSACYLFILRKPLKQLKVKMQVLGFKS